MSVLNFINYEIVFAYQQEIMNFIRIEIVSKFK